MRHAAAATLATTFAVPAAALDRGQQLALGASVLKIEVVQQQGGYALGSGIVLGPAQVVTNCHVTRHARSITVVRGGVRWPVTGQAADVARDLCVLQVPGIDVPPTVMRPARSLRPGERVTAVGYTGGMGLQASTGEVVALHAHHGAPVVQSSNWFTSGASGGGLFDEQARLVGILTFRMRGGEAHYYSAPVEWLAQSPAVAAGYEAIGPLATTELPYWQQPLERQPEFLQAAALARGARWEELQVLALQWTHKATQDPASWYSRGLAEEALGRRPDALASFERAVAADPTFAAGWHRVGLLSVQLGVTYKARRALQALEPLSVELARQLASRIGPS